MIGDFCNVNSNCCSKLKIKMFGDMDIWVWWQKFLILGHIIDINITS